MARCSSSPTMSRCAPLPMQVQVCMHALITAPHPFRTGVLRHRWAWQLHRVVRCAQCHRRHDVFRIECFEPPRVCIQRPTRSTGRRQRDRQWSIRDASRYRLRAHLPVRRMPLDLWPAGGVAPARPSAASAFSAGPAHAAADALIPAAPDPIWAHLSTAQRIRRAPPLITSDYQSGRISLPQASSTVSC